MILLGAAIQDGVQLYEQGKYEQCVAALQDSEPASGERSIYLGLCHFALGHAGDAKQHFEAALAIDPHAKLPPYSPPKVMSFFEQLRPQAPAADLPTAASWFERGDQARASAELARVRAGALDAITDARARLLEGALRLAEGDPRGADAAWRSALLILPSATFWFAAPAEAQARLEQLRAPPARTARWPRVVGPAALGGAFVVTGATLYGLARAGADQLRAGDRSINTAAQLESRNQTLRLDQTLGFIGLGLGVVAMATAIALGLWPDPQLPR